MMIVIDGAAIRESEKSLELERISRMHGECVDKLAAFIRGVLSYESRDELVINAPGEIAALVHAYFGEGSEVYYCAAVREGEEYREILSVGIDDCNYQIIEGNCRREMKSCLLYGSFFEFSFGSMEGRILFHFEGFDCVSDPFFTDMISSAYSGLETALEHIYRADEENGVVMLMALAEKAEADDGYTSLHLKNVGSMSKMLAEAVGMEGKQTDVLYAASMFHDIGKLAIPRSITMKEGRLSEEERTIVNEHTEYGFKLLSAFSEDPRLKLAALIARYHHEHFDGTGKNALVGEDIPIEARIVCICDTFDALTTPRRYKRQWSVSEALDHIRKNAKSRFDPTLVDAFLALEPQLVEMKKED